MGEQKITTTSLCFLLYLFFVSTAVNSQNSGTWSIAGTAIWTTNAGAIGITATATDYGSGTSFTLNDFQTGDMMACSGAYSDAFIFENPSLSIRHTFPNSAFITFTFSQEVKDPVLNLDRLGGGTPSNRSTSSVLTVVTPGVELEELSQNDVHFVTTITSITRESGMSVTASPSECGIPTNGTAAGSVRLKGVFTAVTFEISMNPDEVASANDRFEIAFSNVVAYNECSDGASVNGVPTASDRDGDGVNDICDDDDDNDGVLDVNELCPLVPGATAPDGSEVTWSLSGYDVYTIGGNTNGLGFEESGFEQAVFAQGKTLTVLNNTNDFSVSGNSGDGSAIVSTVSFSNGTMRYVTNHPDNNRAEFRDTTSGGFTSGVTGADGVYVEPELGLTTGDYYSIEIDFTTPVTAFSLDLVDVFDTFTSGSPVLNYQVYADGDLIAYLEGGTIGNDDTGTVSIYDRKGQLRGTHMVGQDIENTIGFVTLGQVNQVVIRHDVTSGAISSSSHDPHGFDGFAFSVSSCDTDNDGVSNHLDTDSDDDGCPDAVEAAGNVIDGLSTLTGGSPTANSSSQNLGTDADAEGNPKLNSGDTDGFIQANDPAVIDASDSSACNIDLSLVKTVNNALPKVGENIVYTITVTNSGPLHAAGVEVVDVLPTVLAYVSDDSDGDYAANIWSVGVLNSGASKTINITATVNQSGTIVNTAQVVAPTNQVDVDSTPNNGN